MEIDLGPEAEKFRDEVRQWLEANAPDSMVGIDDERAATVDAPPFAEWTQKLSDAGYLCVSWPKEFGGRGLSGSEVAVMNEEFARAGVPRVSRGMGEWLVGPFDHRVGYRRAERPTSFPASSTARSVCPGLQRADAAATSLASRHAVS